MTVGLFYEFHRVSLKSLLAFQTAEIEGFSVMGNLEFSSVLVKNYSANWISRHYLVLNLTFR